MDEELIIIFKCLGLTFIGGIIFLKLWNVIEKKIVGYIERMGVIIFCEGENCENYSIKRGKCKAISIGMERGEEGGMYCATYAGGKNDG